MKHLLDDIAKLQHGFGHPCRSEPLTAEAIEGSDELSNRHRMRLRLVTEEFLELLEASYGERSELDDLRRKADWILHQKPEAIDVTETADALADLVVVIVGMALELGLPLDRVWAEVQRSNLAKIVDGKVRYREDGKVLKPEGWTPPDIAAALAEPTEASWTRN